MKGMYPADFDDQAPQAAEKGLQGVVPILEETANVQRVAVDQGGWRITKNVTATEQLVDEELQDVRVQIERRPLGTQLSGSEVPQTRYEGNTLVIPVLEEVLVTEKRLVLVEEVRITQVRGRHRKPQQVNLRKESVSVERLEPLASQSREERGEGTKE